MGSTKFSTRSSLFPAKKEEPVQVQIVNHWRLKEFLPDLKEVELKKFKIYYDELVKFNKKLNLISSKTVPFADVIHFADSILACRLIMNTHHLPNIHDLGSGNGFPGLVMAILYPDTVVTLVEKDSRKSEFMKHIIDILKIENAEVNRTLIELIPENSVNYAMSRGLSSIGKAIIVTRRLFNKDGIYFHLKSEEWSNELAQVPAQISSYWEPSLLGEYKLPIGEVKFAVIKTQKIA